MASGGWGYTPNPFAQPPASSAAAAPDEERPRASNAYGAWGGGVGSGQPPPPAAAPPAAAKPNPIQAVFNLASAAAGGAGGGGAPGGGGGLGGGGGGNVSQREAELARREAELARREAALAQVAENAKPNNFPPLWPLVYHSISEQVVPWNRSLVRWHFLTELLVLLGFVWNTAVMLAAMFAGIIGLQWWLFSLISFVLGAPLSWTMYYKSLFRAANTDGATYGYMRSVICILINIAWCVWMCLAINGLGEFSGGIFPMLRLFQAGGAKNVAFGILYIVNVVIWGLAGVGGWLSMGFAIAAYRRADGPRRDYEARYGAAPMAT